MTTRVRAVAIAVVIALWGALGVAPASASGGNPDYWSRDDIRFFGDPYEHLIMLAVNDNGDAVGITGDSSANPVVRYNGFTPFVLHDASWKGAGLRDINSSGEAVGFAQLLDGVFHGMIYAHGVVTLLPADTLAIGISDDGIIAVNRSDGGAPYLLYPSGLSQTVSLGAFDAAELTDVSTGGWLSGKVGNSVDDFPARWHPDGQLEVLPDSPSYPDSTPTSINASGDAVGYVRDDAATPIVNRPVEWKNGVIQLLGTQVEPGGIARAINNNGLIAGYEYHVDSAPYIHARPTVWENGVPQSVDDLTTTSTSDETYLWGISNNGTLVGGALNHPIGKIYRPHTGTFARVTTPRLLSLKPVDVRLPLAIVPLPLRIVLDLAKLLTLP